MYNFWNHFTKILQKEFIIEIFSKFRKNLFLAVKLLFPEYIKEIKSSEQIINNNMGDAFWIIYKDFLKLNLKNFFLKSFLNDKANEGNSKMV